MRIPGLPLAVLLLVLPVGVSAQFLFVENFNSFDGSGFAPEPAPGQLDSDTYAVSDTNTMSGTFGGTHEFGLFAGGITTAGVVDPGVYALDDSFDRSLMLHSGANDLNPGYLRIRVVNNTGITTAMLEVSYKVVVYNDGTRVNGLSLLYNTVDGPITDYTLAGPPFDTSGLPPNEIFSVNRTATIPISVANGEAFYLMFATQRVGGAGSTDDDVAIDDLVVEMVDGPSIPNLTLDPPSPFFFADTHVSSTSVDQDIQLANDGTGTLEITDVSESASPDCDQFNFQFPATPINLENSEFATMTISFSPTMRAAFSCDITIVSNDPEGNATYTVNGTGIGPSLVLVPPPSVLEFPDTHVGDASGPINFTIRNDGETTLTVISVMIPMGDNDEDYLLGGFFGGTICPACTETVEVMFQPQAAGDQNATIIVNSDDPENPQLEIIDAIGRGIERLIALSPTAVHFGDVYVGYTGVRALMITNPGEASLSVTDLSLSGQDASVFTIIDPEVLPTPINPIEVPGNSSFEVSIECVPASPGAKTASLDVSSNADNATSISATLNCTALDASDLIQISGFE